MSGNLCRCTGYVGIVRAISDVIERRRARGIAAVPDAGRRAIGPAGSGHAKTSAASHLQRSAVAAIIGSPRASPSPAAAATAGDRKSQVTSNGALAAKRAKRWLRKLIGR